MVLGHAAVAVLLSKRTQLVDPHLPPAAKRRALVSTRIECQIWCGCWYRSWLSFSISSAARRPFFLRHMVDREGVPPSSAFLSSSGPVAAAVVSSPPLPLECDHRSARGCGEPRVSARNGVITSGTAGSVVCALRCWTSASPAATSPACLSAFLAGATEAFPLLRLELVVSLLLLCRSAGSLSLLPRLLFVPLRFGEATS